MFLAGTPTVRGSNSRLTTLDAVAEHLLCFGNDIDALARLSLQGRYAIVIADTNAGTVTLLTDRFATIPLYYSVEGGALRCGIDLAEQIGESPDFAIAPQSLFHYLYFHMVPAPHTIYRGVRKLKAAQLCSIEQGGAISQRRHWMPKFRESSEFTQIDLAAELRQVLAGAVKRCVKPGVSTGAFLSGGLDSSSVAGLLAEQSDCATKAFAIGFEADGYDEMPYARLAAKHFGLELVERYVTPDDIVEAFPLIARTFHEPFGNSSALPAYFCAKEAAASGVETLLAGDGGDEIFAGNERYVSRPIFEHYKRLPALLRRPLESIAPTLPDAFPIAQKLKSFVGQACCDIPERLQHYNFLHQIDPREVFDAGFLASIDQHLALQEWREEYEGAPEGTSSLNRMLSLDWQYTLADNDLQKVTNACALAGVDVAFPMLDDALVDFSTQIPSHWKLTTQDLRAFYKRALKGWLPEATISKQKHGFGLPFGVWMREHKPLAELAYSSIEKLRQRYIFRDAFLTQAIELHRNGHSAYHGELVWVLATLSFWIDSHAASQFRALPAQAAM